MASKSSSDDDAGGVVPVESECLATSIDPVTGCLRHRSCDECLRKSGCRVDWNGYCDKQRPDDYFALNNDYRRAIETNATLPVTNWTNVSALASYQEWVFPSIEATYCSVDDAVCTKCIAEKFWLTPSDRVDSRFCVGENGCVCIANCVNSDSTTSCPPPPSTEEYEDTPSIGGQLTLIISLVLGALVLVILGCCVYSIRGIRGRKRPPHDSSEAAIVSDPANERSEGPAYTKHEA